MIESTRTQMGSHGTGATLLDRRPEGSRLEQAMARPGALDRFGSQAGSRYTVKAGDTLSSIAAAHGTTWQRLAQINGLTNPDRLTVGQRLTLPANVAATHVVRPGETLSGIARTMGVSTASLARANGLSNADLIHPGQVLRTGGVAPARRAAEPARAPAPRAAAPRPAPTRTAGAASARRGGPATSSQALADIVLTRGDAQARADLASGKKVVVAQRTDTNVRANLEGRYDDPISVVWKNADGTYSSRTFRGNTEPSGQYAFDGTRKHKGSTVDLNRDGNNDSGRLLTGTYRYSERAVFNGNRAFQVSRTQVVERDTNQDGLFDRRDPVRIDRTGAQTTMYIHQGGRSNTQSAGCQTVPSAEYNQFLRTLGRQTTFSYVLVTARP